MKPKATAIVSAIAMNLSVPSISKIYLGCSYHLSQQITEKLHDWQWWT
jgi:hypothetical protein